jgi:hypothetical protein
MLWSLLNAVVFAKTGGSQPVAADLSEAATATQTRPERVTVPMPLTVNERFLEVREVTTAAVVTVIEVLSPKKKRAGEGRAAYEKKRRVILGSATHLVELDLLRGGTPQDGAYGCPHYSSLPNFD